MTPNVDLPICLDWSRVGFLSELVTFEISNRHQEFVEYH